MKFNWFFVSITSIYIKIILSICRTWIKYEPADGRGRGAQIQYAYFKSLNGLIRKSIDV